MINIRNTPDCLVRGLIAANNQLLLDNISTKFHLTQWETTNRTDYQNPSVTRTAITTADATVDTEAWALINEIKDVCDVHFADTIAHDTATSAAVTVADATDTTTGVALANEIKANINTHYTASNVHYTNDETNTVTNSDSTDDATLQVLVNEIKGVLNLHVASAPAGTYVNVVPA